MTIRIESRAPMPGSDAELAALTSLYAQHAPDLRRGDNDAVLLAAARSHRALAQRRPVGVPIIAITEPAAAAGDPVPGSVVEIITDDMPFVVESVLGALERAGAQPERVIHPIVVARRDASGDLTEVLLDADPVAPPPGATVESWTRVELAAPVAGPDSLREALEGVLRDVREVIADVDPMLRRALDLADELVAGQPSVPAGGASAEEIADLLRWLADGHLAFLGYRYYAGVEEDDLRPEGEGLGVLRRDTRTSRAFAPGDATTGAHQLRHEPLLITRANVKGPLRAVHPYYMSIRTVDHGGLLTGEHRFLGMLTVPAMYESVLDIPVVARRVQDAIHRAGFPLDSYSGQQMLEVISGLPREELFSADEQRLYATATGVLAITGRRAVRLFLRRDPYRRFISALVYLPRDRYTTSSRLAMSELLQERLGGRAVDYAARVSEWSLALVHFTVHTEPTASGFETYFRPDTAAATEALQDELTESVRTWDDRFLGQPRCEAAAAALLSGVPEAYKASVDPTHAAEDLRRVAALRGQGAFDVRLYQGSIDAASEWRLTLYLAGAPATLTSILPLLQQLGVEVLDERAAEFARPDGLRCWLYDFGLRIDDTTQAALAGHASDEIDAAFCAAFSAAWRGDAESDWFSPLVLRAGLPWREVAVLRAYARYARQLGVNFGMVYIAETLVAHAEVACGLMALFHARFDPALSAEQRPVAIEVATAALRTQIEAVTGLDADRILRAYVSGIAATVRTNWYRQRPFFSFKIDPTAVPEMPAPRPRFEIFVYSPRVEGVHLRFGPVARGGLRWSDRQQDYRTEILGLVKAQNVKNAVIVPVGAKGGFVVRRADLGADEVQACYRMFIAGLLDVTDNLVDGVTVPPPDVVRHDGDDSYLVVAADKGTARFSDVANEVAASYGFWLGDAFASGGSVGYDHKAMGITARGAWASVQRHFREMGVDTQNEDFTVVGIGDMSGDVFGNGMLLSPHIRLLAAFDHRHVFIDPDPDAAAGFAERQRLFALPRSSWDDYDRAAISPGGGVWPRTAKAVPVGPELRAALGIPERASASVPGGAGNVPERASASVPGGAGNVPERASASVPGGAGNVTGDVLKLSPPELVAAILRAPADLLWNGGIGTYVKASDESHTDAGDKANDAVRADATELRVKVIGEGGNLGLTQRGRIEFARAGGRINTDAIDNSAGVDCSDHEVNIKILLDRLVTAGQLNRPGRDTLLAQMTDEVAALVLAHNHDQNAVLGVARAHAPAMIEVQGRLTADLVARTGLDRALEVLPDADGFAAHDAAGTGLTGPELATLLAHTKLDLTARVLDTDLPTVSAFAARLSEYFPRALRERFPAAITAHPLRREIVTTQLVNEMVDGAGITYAFRLGEELSAGPDDTLRAYAVTTAVFDLPQLWSWLGGVGSAASRPGATGPRAQIPTAVADQVLLESRRLLDRASRWFLTHRPQPLAVDAAISRFAATVRELRRQLPELIIGRERATVLRGADELTAAGVPAERAVHCAALVYGYGLLDVVELTEISERDREPRDPVEVARLYYALSEHLGIDSALTSVSALEHGDRWHALARLALRDDLYGSLRAITLDALREATPGTDPESAIEQWERANASRLVRARAALHEVGTAGQLDLATLSVVSRQLRGLAR